MSTVKTATLQNTGSGAPAFQNSSGTEIGQLCKAWVNFNGTGTVTIRDDFNVSSITDSGTGNYKVNFSTAMPNANYCFVVGPQRAHYADGSILSILAFTDSARSTSQLQLIGYAVNPGSSGFEDPLALCVAIFGD